MVTNTVFIPSENFYSAHSRNYSEELPALSHDLRKETSDL